MKDFFFLVLLTLPFFSEPFLYVMPVIKASVLCYVNDDANSVSKSTLHEDSDRLYEEFWVNNDPNVAMELLWMKPEGKT